MSGAEASTLGRPLDERVASLETNLVSVVAIVKDLASEVRTGFRDTRQEREGFHAENQRSLRTLESRLTETQRPQYSTWAAWSAVILSIVFGVGTIVTVSMQRASDSMAAKITNLEQTRLDNAYLRGQTDANVAALRDSQKEMQVTTQRETEMSARRLDEKLQIEFKGFRDIQQKDLDWMRDRLDKLVQTYQTLVGSVQSTEAEAGRLSEQSRWAERLLLAVDARTQETRSSVDTSTAKQSERTAVFEDLKRRVLLLEGAKPGS